MAKKTPAEPRRTDFVRHGKLRRSNAWGNAVKVLLTTVLVVGLSGVATAAYAVWGLMSNVHTVELNNEASTVGAGDQSLDGELTILLVGSDSRKGQKINDGEEGELNDVNLLLHVSADHKNATVVSFPRDLMVPIPSCSGPNGEPDYYPAMSEQQLNSTLEQGGLPCVARTISQLSGMPINYAGLVTFDGVIGISNAIGGVDVCLTQPIVDPATDLDLPAGDNTLVGKEALQFLRTRHGVGDGGDTSRISNQQVFMSALVREMKSADTLSDPRKVYGLAKAAVENVTFSSNMASVPFLQKIAGTVKDINLDNINFVQYPASDHPYQTGRLTPDTASAEQLFAVIKSGKPFDVTGVGQGVEVEGKSGKPTTGAPTTPAAPPEGGAPATEAPATDAPAGGTPATPAPTKGPDGKVQLPENITGTKASQQTCSQGRTVY
ncbi:LCP family protein [Leucobacter sp. CSA2]|uniref:LCP family protein n=1 Tax=Leucobacter edaphi TaxID=2796472 RepID=A0A934QET2_9MICO|nr:LCP family protein [Leucobacter edaphi]MBK0422199.1 LCP family protein [Leucobacter edaphi]